MTNETEGFQPSSVTLNWTSTYNSFIFHHGELWFSHPIFISSNWTQRIRYLVNFITYLEALYLLDYNYIVIPPPTGFFVSAYHNGEGVQKSSQVQFHSWSFEHHKHWFCLYDFGGTLWKFVVVRLVIPIVWPI